MSDASIQKSGAENRREVRSVWNRQINGQLYLHVDGMGDLKDVSLRDVSANGASMSLPKPLDIGTEVSIVLATPDMRLSFMATVAWCAPAREEPGIRIHPSQPNAIGLHIRGAGSFASMLKSCQINHTPGKPH